MCCINTFINNASFDVLAFLKAYFLLDFPLFQVLVQVHLYSTELVRAQMILAGMSGSLDSPNSNCRATSDMLYCTAHYCNRGEEWSWVLGNSPTAISAPEPGSSKICPFFKMMSGNCFLDSVAGRISNGRLAPEHRILQPNTDQRPTDPDPNFL